VPPFHQAWGKVNDDASERERENGKRDPPQLLGGPKLAPDGTRVVHEHIDAAPQRNSRFGLLLHLRKGGRNIEREEPQPVPGGIIIVTITIFHWQQTVTTAVVIVVVDIGQNRIRREPSSVQEARRGDDPVAAGEDALGKCESQSGESACVVVQRSLVSAQSGLARVSASVQMQQTIWLSRTPECGADWGLTGDEPGFGIRWHW